MNQTDSTDVTIVGSGPVGLYLACRLALAGQRCTVLEKRNEISQHSRAIGIHPPGLQELATIGVTDSFLQAGIALKRARGYSGSRPIAGIDFTSVLNGPFPFVLSIPQVQTEALLAERLETLSPGSLRRGAQCIAFTQTNDQVTVRYRMNDRDHSLTSLYLVGCDGIHSTVRDCAGIAIERTSYPDRYAMGDFAGCVALGEDAALFLSPHGIVESFPLPNQRRRWVVRLTDNSNSNASAESLTRDIAHRTGLEVSPDTCTMLSEFGVGSALASALVHRRILLAGDAAHVCSPMGGQGMNLGLIGAGQLAEALLREDTAFFTAYDRTQRQLAKQVIARAVFNTRLGRGGFVAVLTANAFAGLLRVPPLHDYFARRFTMQDLPLPETRTPLPQPVPSR